MPSKGSSVSSQKDAELVKQMNEIAADMEIMKIDNYRLALRVTSLEGNNIRLQNELSDLSSQVEDITYRNMQRNLIFQEIEENKNENVKDSVYSFMKERLKLTKKLQSDVTIDIAHRMGKFRQGQVRPIVACFTTREAVDIVKRHASNLKGTSFRISPQLPREMRARRIAQIPVMKDLRQKYPESKILLVKDTLIQDGKPLENNFRINPIKSSPDPSVTYNFKTDISHGEVLTEKNSIFQAHGIRVGSLTEVQAAKRALFQDGKVADCTHIIYSYALTDETSGMKITGHDDDGEWGAAASLSALLNQRDGVFIAVVRKYGGVNLGQRRFAIINELGSKMIESLLG